MRRSFVGDKARGSGCKKKKKIEKNGADRESALQTKMTTLQSDILKLGQEKEQTRKDNEATVNKLQDNLKK
jgi:hypothetical protein